MHISQFKKFKLPAIWKKKYIESDNHIANLPISLKKIAPIKHLKFTKNIAQIWPLSYQFFP